MCTTLPPPLTHRIWIILHLSFSACLYRNNAQRTCSQRDEPKSINQHKFKILWRRIHNFHVFVGTSYSSYFYTGSDPIHTTHQVRMRANRRHERNEKCFIFLYNTKNGARHLWLQHWVRTAHASVNTGHFIRLIKSLTFQHSLHFASMPLEIKAKLHIIIPFPRCNWQRAFIAIVNKIICSWKSRRCFARIG